MSTTLRLPVRVGSDRRLKIMPVDEARRLEETLASAPAYPAPTVELLMLPDEDSWLWGAGHHFASEFWVTTAGDQATFHIRFDPPLVGESLRADVPPPHGAGWLGEIGVDLALDADGDSATGTLESKVHQEAGGSWPARTPPGAAEFGIDRILKVYGKKFDAGGGTKAWSIRVELTDFFAEVVRSEGEVTIRSGGKQTLLELRHSDPRIKIEGDLLRVTVPVSVAGVRPGGSYRVRLGNNSDFSDSRDIVVHEGKVQTP